MTKSADRVVIDGNDCHSRPANVRGFVIGRRDGSAAMTTRDDILEAITHVIETKARLAAEPGTHGQRATLDDKIDALLDQLNLVPA